MATSTPTFPIPTEVWQLLAPIDFRQMYELGNKKSPDAGTYKAVFENMGIDHVSIDWNGLDGALPLDLNRPIEHLPPREMVTNIGTTEHVENQHGVFDNIHRLANRRIVHWVPYQMTTPDHGYYGYDEDFFERLAELNGYHIEKMYTTPFGRFCILCCALTKIDDAPFQWDDGIRIYRKAEGQ